MLIQLLAVELGNDMSIAWPIALTVGGMITGYVVNQTRQSSTASSAIERIAGGLSRLLGRVDKHEERIDSLENKWLYQEGKQAGAAKAKADHEQSSESSVMRRERDATRKHPR